MRDRNDGDAVGATVGVLARGHDDGVDEVSPEAIAQPEQMPNVVVIDANDEFALDGQDSSVAGMAEVCDGLSSEPGVAAVAAPYAVIQLRSWVGRRSRWRRAAMCVR